MWQDLVAKYNLEDQVEKFVNDLVFDIDAARIFARKREAEGSTHGFYFHGTDSSSRCEAIGKPHIPHIMWQYSSVSDRTLDHYCLGQEGELPGQGKLRIQVMENRPGSPEEPGMARGIS